MKVTEEVIKLYNENESTATENNLELYRIMRWKHLSDKESFNIKKQVSSSEDIFYHLNRFSEDASTLINEIGGFTEKDITELRDIANKLKFLSDLPFPIDSMLSAWAARKKILSAKPNVKYILEVGPGAGLISLLLNKINTLVNYTQIEATQSLYLSQMAINAIAFAEVYEAALDNNPPFDYHRLWHIPWWKVKWLNNAPIKYDVIIACSCLCEMTEAALDFYSPLFTSKATDECVFIIQGCGFEYPINQGQMLNKLKDFGWNVIHSETDEQRGGICLTTMVNYWLNRTNNPINKPIRDLSNKNYIYDPRYKEELIKRIVA